MRKKNKISLVLLLIFIGLVFVSCELQEEAIHQHEYNSILKLYEMKFEELMTNKKFVNSFSKLPKSTTATVGRTVMENDYGFTIANKPAKVIENNGEISYTFLITRDSTDTDSFENLVIQTDSSNTTKAVIIKYNLTSPITSSEDNSYSFTYNTKIKPIVYNNTPLSTSSKTIIICYWITTTYCNNTLSGEIGPEHIAGPDCRRTYTRSVYRCTAGDDGTVDNIPMGDGGSDGGGGGSATPDSNYDGSDTSIHGNGGNNINTAPVAPEVDPIILIKDPCLKVKSPFTKVPTLALRNANLSSMTNEQIEYGFFMLNNASSTTINPFSDLNGGSSGSVELPISPSEPIIVLSHTHNSPSDRTYSVPSWEDLDNLSYYMQLYPNSIDPNIVFITITADGTRYAITINNFQKFKDFFYWGMKFDPNNFDSSKLINKNKNSALYYNGDPTQNPPLKPLIKENSAYPEQDLKYFLNMLQSNDAGVDVFEINSDFNSFTKVVFNKSTNNINRTNCN
jgi:hypothetical protein